MAARWAVPCRWALVFILFNVVYSKEAKGADKKDSSKKSAAAASNPPDVGPAMPGDEKYWTKLLGLGFSEGTLQPQFDPEVLKYELRIKSGKSKELLVTPLLNQPKYDLLYKPKLIWLGKDMKYSPIENIEFKLDLSSGGSGPLDKHATLEVKDPSSKSGVFGNSGAKAHAYIIHISQAPDVESIVSATGIVVHGHTAKGEKTHPLNPFNASSPHNEIRYIVREDVKYIDVTVTCKPEATGLKYNGKSYAMGSVYTSQPFEGATKSILGQCLYKDDKWTSNDEMQRTYVITVSRNASLAGTTVDLRMWPPSENGACVRLDVTTPGALYFGWNPGWRCMKAPPDAQFVGSYDNPKAELVVVNNRSGGRYRLWNGIPTSIPVAEDKHDDSLMLEAGNHQKNYSFLFGPPPGCPTYHYEKNDKFLDATWKKDQINPNVSWKCPAKYEINERTSKLYCKWKPCKDPVDTAKCCTKVRALCASYDTAKFGAMDCPKNLVFHPEKRCAWTPCSNKHYDVNLCCAPKVKGSNAPCTTMTCPADSVLVPDAPQLACATSPCTTVDQKMCCEQRAICNSMDCPAGYSGKYNAALYLCAKGICGPLDRDTCCDAAAYCDEFTCPATGKGGTLGWLKKPAAATIPCGGDPCIEWDTGICCNKIGFCSTLTCPLGYYPKKGSERIPCEGGGIEPCSQTEDLARCCAPAASCDKSYVCTLGFRLKLGAKFLHCPGSECADKDRNLCCDMVNPFQAASSTVLHPSKGEGSCHMLDGPTSFSCEATGDTLHLVAEFKFDQPVGNKIWMGGVKLMGQTAVLQLQPIKVYEVKNPLHVAVHSRVAGRGEPTENVQIWIVPPATTTTTTKTTTTKTTTEKPKEEKSSEKKESKEDASGKEKSSGKDDDKDKTSGDENKGSEKETTLRKLDEERRRLLEAAPASETLPRSSSWLSLLWT